MSPLLFLFIHVTPSSSKRWCKSSIPRYVSIKIAALDSDASREAAHSKHIAEADPSHEGLSFIRLPLEAFQLHAPQGSYFCLVFEPMRETLFDLQRRLPGNRIPLQLFKLYVFCLLEALDYLHSACHLIHTDIEDDNIMITFEHDAVLKNFATRQKDSLQPRRTRPGDGRAIYLSQSDFGTLQGRRLLPRLADFNLCFHGVENQGHLSAIQAHRYRAPEVLLGYVEPPGRYEPVERPAGDDGEYDAHVHLAQMVSLLGDPPKLVIERERLLRQNRLKKSILDARGKECMNMNEFWGGPFFDDDDSIMRKDLIRREITLADTVKHLQDDDKEQFLDFASGMLEWLPEKRRTAKQLMQHQFLESLRKDRERYL
ncbi:tyrosinase precursor [Metarhizium robertsii ARSEF 23]|uniref:Tyrosinase n=1 Tax=Metarhizium robertsii (strain ARSEF 23 / ATCC MYA-3075) TaxID=655844 RepID=A0A0B2XJ14_METRA|nr:tyrosinase precursor [Metarhizium robertsii ARSEF 23]KHO11487.1 tyrosinase precursor [Metarhizium robertsii ARSEF 23]